MAGTLVISTLSDGTNSTSSTNCIQGSAKAWVNCNASGTVAASYNVGSVTRNATGTFTVNFTNAMPDANYAALATTVQRGGVSASIDSVGYGNTTSSQTLGTYSTTAVQFYIQNSATGATLDPPVLSVAVFR